MFTEMKKRKYTQRRRAEQQDQTRARILEAAVALHEELGPARTSIKAVAERAGVQRLTVYRHFPDDSSLFQACTSHWLTLHPPPAIPGPPGDEAPAAYTRAGLRVLYRYYRDTGMMWQGAYRDREQVEALQAPMAGFEAYLDELRNALLAAWPANGEAGKQRALTLRHGLAFGTWQSLTGLGLGDSQAADLVTSWLDKAV